jgi:beta-lactamase regulating signal transducer with metallopeptidase domain
MDDLGRLLVSWLVAVNAWTAVLLVGALAVDRALARHARASLRILLYAPVALRVVLPLSGWITVARAPRLSILVSVAEAVGRTSASSGSGGKSAFTWYAALAVAYALVASVLAVRAVLRRVRLARALASAQVVESLEAPCPVVRHDELGPMVAGVLSPRIVLPRSLLDEIGGSALSCVLSHESAHVRRRDPWLSAVLELLVIAAWPVAPLWIASARVRHLVELACDEAALAGADTAERRRYGHVLLDLAEQRPAFVAAGLHFGSTLRARIEALASQRPWPRPVQAGLVGAGVLIFVACSSVGPAGPGSAGSASASSSLPAVEHENGRLPPDVIQAEVRANFGRFRACYEEGAARDPKLRGTVEVAFTIEEDGTVHDAADHNSTMPDRAVVDCVVRAFDSTTYPRPSGGQVTVIYPVQFDPEN